MKRNVNLDDDVDRLLRLYIVKKGDLSRIVNEALKLWLTQNPLPPEVIKRLISSATIPKEQLEKLLPKFYVE